MPYTFTAYEIMNLAVEIEQATAAFYRRLSGLTRNPAIEDVFLILSEHEEAHLHQFAAFAEKYKADKQVYENSTDLSGLMKINQQKMEVLLGHEISGLSTQVLKEAIDIAIKGEEDTILIYSWLNKALDESHQHLLKEIIATEKSHRDLVVGLKNKLFDDRDSYS